jgi:maleylpyruvate isomerase
MKLYGYWRSSSTWRVRIGLTYKGIAFETVPVHLVRDGGEQHRPDYVAINPMRQVPALSWSDGANSHVLCQSLAVLEYLEETYPSPPLLPRDPFARALVRQLAEMVNSGIQPLQNSRVLQHLETLGVDATGWARTFIVDGLNALESAVAPVAGRFSVGNELSFADVCLVPQLYNARRFQLDVVRWPTLARVEGACFEVPAFERTHPDRQPDALPGGA